MTGNHSDVHLLTEETKSDLCWCFNRLSNTQTGSRETFFNQFQPVEIKSWETFADPITQTTFMFLAHIRPHIFWSVNTNASWAALKVRLLN